MKIKLTDIGSQIIGILISLIIFIIGLVITKSDDFGSVYGLVISTTISIYVLIVSEKISSAIRERNTLSNLDKKLPKDIKSITQFTNSNEALEYLCSQFNRTKLVLNTMIEKENENHNPGKKIIAAKENYKSSITKLMESEVEYHEISTKTFVDTVKSRMKLSNENYGMYSARFLEEIPTSFLNFTIVKYDNEEKEIVIGWATTTYDVNQPAFKINDKRIVDYFEEIFHSLYNKSKDLNHD